MRLEGMLNLGHQKLPRQVAGSEDCAMRDKGKDDVDAWDIWVTKRMAAEMWERDGCSMIVGGLCGAGLVDCKLRK